MRPEVWVSFAWARDRAAPLMDKLCQGLREADYDVRRDSDDLRPGDRISDFMRQLGAGRCVVVVLSAAYLRSPYSMTELAGIWREARRDPIALRADNFAVIRGLIDQALDSNPGATDPANPSRP